MLCICLQITLIVVNIYVELNKSDLKTVSVCDKVAVGIFWLNIKAKKDLNYNLSCICLPLIRAYYLYYYFIPC